QGLQAEAASAEGPADPVLERPRQPGVGVAALSGVLQPVGDDLADRVLPDLAEAGAAGEPLPAVPGGPGPPQQPPEVEAGGALTAFVPWIDVHRGPGRGATAVRQALGNLPSEARRARGCARWGVGRPHSTRPRVKGRSPDVQEIVMR